jgi:hypothetical protein
LGRDPHNILARWKKHFSKLLNAHGVNYIGRREIYTAEALMPEPSAFQLEMTIKKPKKTQITKY